MKTTRPTLPEIVTRYFAAANRFDAAAAADCFTALASVHDEHRNHTGPEAIRAWVAETSRKYRPRFVVTGAKVSGANIELSVGVSGQFPGSPIELDYRIRLQEGKISALTIE